MNCSSSETRRKGYRQRRLRRGRLLDWHFVHGTRRGEALSWALGGLPLAHEQAAARCERRSTSFAAYLKRFEATPARFLDDTRHAPMDYGRTVAKTFALAIDEAAQLHPAAEPLRSNASATRRRHPARRPSASASSCYN